MSQSASTDGMKPMIRTRLLTGAAAIAMLMAGTQDAQAQQSSASVRIVVAPISRISFTGMPGERSSDPAYLALDADAITSADPANDARLIAPSSTDAELRTTSSQSLEFPGAEAVDDGQALCATSTDRRSARSTGPMPRLSMSYSADGGDSEEPEPTITCTLIAP